MDRLGPAAAAALVALGRPRTLRAGDVLFMEGEPADRLAVVTAGRVRCTTLAASGVTSVLDVAGPGELVGEVAVFDQAPRSAEVTAVERAETLLVGRSDFEHFLAEHGSATLELVRQLCQRLRTSNNVRADLSAGTTVRTRVARRLDALAAEHGIPSIDGDVVIDLSISHEELGAWVGASREAVSRSIGELRGLGVIRSDRRRITVLDPDGLRAHAR